MGAIAYALSFSPWITYGAVSASLTWRAGVYAALIVQVALAASLSSRRELDALSVGTLAFFGAMSGVALASPHAAIHRWIAALSAGALAVIALASLAVARWRSCCSGMTRPRSSARTRSRCSARAT